MAQSDPVIDLTLDYHAHILPRCDHGSDGVETSLRQLAMAAVAGIRTVCAPPHFYPHRENAAASLERRARCPAAPPPLASRICSIRCAVRSPVSRAFTRAEITR